MIKSKSLPFPDPDQHYVELNKWTSGSPRHFRLAGQSVWGYMVLPLDLRMADLSSGVHHKPTFVLPKYVARFLTEAELLRTFPTLESAVLSDGLERHPSTKPVWSTTDERKRDFLRRDLGGGLSLGRPLRQVYEREGVEEYEGEDGHTYVRPRKKEPALPMGVGEGTW